MLLTVDEAWRLTPNMIRVNFSGPGLADFPEGREGGNCKLLLPEPDETCEHFSKRLLDGSPLVKRTYTVRHYSRDSQVLSIDFVAHGDEGPASRWASHARRGDFLGFSGPSEPKVAHFEADWYLVAADPSAIPVVAATLEAMPRHAKGVAVFEVTSLEDKQDIDAPAGVEMHWLIHPDPHVASTAQEAFIRALHLPDKHIQTCIAGESGVIKSLREILSQRDNLQRSDTYIAGYWKIGLIEDEHQKTKRAKDG